MENFMDLVFGVIRMKNIIQLLLKNDWSKFTFNFFFLFSGKRNYKENKSSQGKLNLIMKYIKVGEISKAVHIINSPSANPPHNNDTLNKIIPKIRARKLS
jgi:hypothetical protein